MAETPYPFTRVFPKVAGLTGISNVDDETPITLTQGVPGFMYHADAEAAELAGEVEIMAGNSKLNMTIAEPDPDPAP